MRLDKVLELFDELLVVHIFSNSMECDIYVGLVDNVPLKFSEKYVVTKIRNFSSQIRVCVDEL
jgi:hypothetical protein|nr:MAG TPA: hypothetical protein [Microviridae sp.]